MQLVRRSLSRSVVALAVLLWCAPPAPALALDVSTIHIDNFGKVNDRYYRGGQPSGSDYAALAAAGIKTVINLTSDDAQPNERAMTEAAGMKYFQIPMTTHLPPTPTQIAQFLAIVNTQAAQPVYVHCVGGRHRTGVMTAIYRMTHDGWSESQAFAEMKHKVRRHFLPPNSRTRPRLSGTEAAHAAPQP